MNFEGSYKLTMTPSGESIETRNAENAPLEIVKLRDKSTENLVLDNRLSLEPPDLIPKISSLNRKASSVQDVRDATKKYDYGRISNEKYRLLKSYHNNNVSGNNINNSNSRVSCDNLRNQSFGLQNESNGESSPCRRSSEETVRAVPSADCEERSVTEPPAEKIVPIAYQSKEETSDDEEEEEEDERESEEAEGKKDENYGVSFAVREIEVNEKMEKEKVVTLQRVRSAQEKRVSRSDSTKNSEKLERSKSLKSVERSASFGRADAVERPEKDSCNSSVSDASSQTESEEKPKKAEEAREEVPEVAKEEVVDETVQKKLEEELEYERLSRDLASQLSPSDKLQGLLGKCRNLFLLRIPISR